MSKHKSHKNNRTNKTTIIINTSRKAGPQIEIQKHFLINKRSSNKVNQGIQTFPFVGDLTENVIQNEEKYYNTQSTSYFSKSESLLPTLDFDSQFDFLKDNDVIDKIRSSNKELEDRHKHFSVNDNVSQRNVESNNVYSASSLKTPTNTPILKSFVDTANKVGDVKVNVTSSNRSSVRFQTTNNSAKVYKTCSDSAIIKDDPSVELKNEIMQYRQSIKNKVLEEKMERKLEELYKRNQQEVQVLEGSFDWISTWPVPNRPTGKLLINIL